MLVARRCVFAVHKSSGLVHHMCHTVMMDEPLQWSLLLSS
jgi:hypothetical protein